MDVKNHINSLFNSISYSFDGVLIDPGDEWEDFYNVRLVLLTHVHFDHIYGLNRVIELNPNVVVYTNIWGYDALKSPKLNLSKYHNNDFVLKNIEHVEIVKDRENVRGAQKNIINAIYTPGHNPSCITWIAGETIFTGDSYIPGCRPVTNLPGGNKIQANESIHLIKELSKGRMICPGHNITV